MSLLCAAPRALAQSAEVQAMQPGRGMVLAHVNAGEHPFSVSFGRGRHPIAECDKECDFWAWPAKYRVLIHHGEGPHDDVSVALNIRRTGNYTFVPAHGGAQNAGLILGVSGPVIGFVGAVLTVGGVLRECSDPPPGQGCDRPAIVYVGLGMFAVGAGMTAIGWPLYIHNRAHFQASDGPAALPAARLGVLPMPHGGLGLGATFAF